MRDRRLDGGLVCLGIAPSKKCGTHMKCARPLHDDEVAEIDEKVNETDRLSHLVG